jgi:hypothetical protein
MDIDGVYCNVGIAFFNILLHAVGSPYFIGSRMNQR